MRGKEMFGLHCMPLEGRNEGVSAKLKMREGEKGFEGYKTHACN